MGSTDFDKKWQVFLLPHGKIVLKDIRKFLKLPSLQGLTKFGCFEK
jgi:hypothetical protein